MPLTVFITGASAGFRAAIARRLVRDSRGTPPPRTSQGAAATHHATKDRGTNP